MDQSAKAYYTADNEDLTKYLCVTSKGAFNKYSNPIAEYIFTNSHREPDILRRLYEKTSEELGKKAGMISDSTQCQFLRLLLKIMNAKKAIEIGVFTGYNMLSVAMTLPKDGKVIGCDISSKYFEIGRPFIEEAGVMDKIDLRIQPAVQTLDELLAAGEGGTFDFIYVDANKCGYDTYYEKGLQLLKSGGIIALDNMLWDGQVTKEEKDEETTSLHNLNQKIHTDERVDNSLLLLGDGMNLVRKI